LLPGFVKPKVVASRNNVERSCAPWIGASILTSLGSFQQLWLSRTEYEEYGATMGIQRFP
jgi:actin-like protein 6A